jgi:hypothetical protein
MQEKVQIYLIYDNAPRGASLRENASMPCKRNLGSGHMPENQRAEGQGSSK